MSGTACQEAGLGAQKDRRLAANCLCLIMDPHLLCGVCAGNTKRAFPETYRDEWQETSLIADAAAEARAMGAPVQVAAA